MTMPTVPFFWCNNCSTASVSREGTFCQDCGDLLSSQTMHIDRVIDRLFQARERAYLNDYHSEWDSISDAITLCRLMQGR